MTNGTGRSKIDEFKNAGLSNYRSTRTLSLVDASSVGIGSAARIVYTNGLTCEHSDGLRHNCAYVDFRNSKIPAALQLAARNTRPDTSEAQRFCEAMSELCGTPGWTP